MVRDIVVWSYGYLLYLMGEYQEALKYVEIDLEQVSRNRWNHYHVTLIPKALGDDDKSEKALLKSTELINKHFKNTKYILRHSKMMKEADDLIQGLHDR